MWSWCQTRRALLLIPVGLSRAVELIRATDAQGLSGLRDGNSQHLAELSRMGAEATFLPFLLWLTVVAWAEAAERVRGRALVTYGERHAFQALRKLKSAQVESQNVVKKPMVEHMVHPTSSGRVQPSRRVAREEARSRSVRQRSGASGHGALGGVRHSRHEAADEVCWCWPSSGYTS